MAHILIPLDFESNRNFSCASGSEPALTSRLETCLRVLRRVPNAADVVQNKGRERSAAGEGARRVSRSAPLGLAGAIASSRSAEGSEAFHTHRQSPEFGITPWFRGWRAGVLASCSPPKSPAPRSGVSRSSPWVGPPLALGPPQDGQSHQRAAPVLFCFWSSSTCISTRQHWSSQVWPDAHIAIRGRS